MDEEIVCMLTGVKFLVCPYIVNSLYSWVHYHWFFATLSHVVECGVINGWLDSVSIGQNSVVCDLVPGVGTWWEKVHADELLEPTVVAAEEGSDELNSLD